MHCNCCDRLLNDSESTRKSKTTGEYLDICNSCYSTISEDVPSTVRIDYEPDEIPDDELLFNTDEVTDYDD